ncbi:MAG: hypothetical protein IJY27_01800 [Clostridia bacterium]|nr:hypothetical protein [Clostridia bacterium]
MKIFIRIISFALSLIALLLTLGCKKDVADITEEEWLAMGRNLGERSYIIMYPNGIEDPEDAPEVSYTADDFVAYTEKYSYTMQELAEEKIVITLKPAENYEGIMTKYVAPCIEKWEKGEWKRIYYFAPGFWNHTYALRWFSVDTKDIINHITYTVQLECFYPEPTPGKYRMVIFMGKECYVYAEFELTK